MKIITRPLRMMRIIFIMMRYNIDEIILGTHWFFLYVSRCISIPTIGQREKLSRGERIRLALENWALFL